MNKKTFFWILTLQFLFGLNYLISQTIVLHYSPIFWAFFRSLFTAVVILGILYFKKELNLADVRQFKKELILLAASGIVVNQGCFLLGLKFTTSYNSALINTLIPICTLLVAALTGFEALNKRKILGAIVALSGVLVLTPLSEMSFTNQHLWGDILTLGNVIAYSIFLVLNREFVKNHSPLWTTGWVFLLGSLGLLLILPIDPPAHSTLAPPPAVLRALSYGLIGGTLIPYLILSYTLKTTKSSTVALFVYLQPAIVGGLAALFYDHHFTKESFFATLLIFTGVFVGTRPLKRKSES